MSRSYKRFPGVKDHSKSSKICANRKVRHAEEVGDGGNYKHYFEQWDICDYNCRWYSRPEVIDWYEKSVEEGRVWMPKPYKLWMK